MDLTFLTYNRFNVVLKCFNSFRFTLDDPKVHWHILDNASDENLSNYLFRLEKKHPNVHVYLSTYNRGVAGGRKYLLEQCQSDIIGFLDSDTECFNPHLLNLIRGELRNKKIGVIGQRGAAISRHWKPVLYSPTYSGFTDTLSGFCQFFRRKDILRYQIDIDLDFNYAGAEDDDFCFQFKNHGLQIKQVPELNIRHHFSGTWDTSNYDRNLGKLKEKWISKPHLFKML